MKELSEIARSELVEAITERTGRKTVGEKKPAAGKLSDGLRRKCRTATPRSKG